MSMFVLAVICAIVLRDAFIGLEGYDTPSAVLNNTAPPPTAVIVAGAWRLPSGALSRAFTNRILAGARVALLTESPILLLTGGHNESVKAKEYLMQLRNASSLLFPSSFTLSSVAAESPAADDDEYGDDGEEVRLSPAMASRAAGLALEMEKHETLGDFLEAMRPPQRLTVLFENVSTTTAQNAIFAQLALRDAHVGEMTDFATLFPAAAAKDTTNMSAQKVWHCTGCRFVVVSSPYHLLRCRALFAKYLAFGWVATEVLTYSSGHDEWELVLPTDGVIAASDSLFGTDILVPGFLARAAHTVFLTYRHWRSHVRATMMSLGWYMGLREFGAIAKGMYTGELPGFLIKN